MLMTIQVNADTAESARRQAIAQAHAMGYARVSMARVVTQNPPDATGANRSYEVQVDAVR
jgi:hypothetical protein